MPLVSDWWNLRKLERLRRETRKAYAEKAEQYRKDKNRTAEDMQALDAEEYFESKMVDEAVNVFLSNRLLDQAAHYDIEIPQDDGAWQYSEDGQQRYLNAKARASLREFIHPAKTRNFEEWARWIPFIMAFAGLIGVITGLVAVLKK
jgi:hypothetical protein